MPVTHYHLRKFTNLIQFNDIHMRKAMILQNSEHKKKKPQQT